MRHGKCALSPSCTLAATTLRPLLTAQLFWSRNPSTPAGLRVFVAALSGLYSPRRWRHSASAPAAAVPADCSQGHLLFCRGSGV